MAPEKMQAMVIDEFGGPEMLQLRQIPVPDVGAHEVLIRLAVAGVGEWDPFEREGGYVAMMGLTPTFPYVLGSEGAGEVVAVGDQVDRFRVGDPVYAAGFLNPSGGFYAEYVVIDADLVSSIPKQLTLAEAAVMSGVAVTALRGIEDTLGLTSDQVIVIVGASGGIGHLAIQLAKRIGARVIAVASGADGMALATEVGADDSLDGRAADLADKIRVLAPNGVDAVLLTVGGEVADAVMGTVVEGGAVAYPTGVNPEPVAPAGVEVRNFNGDPDREILDRLDARIGSEPFHVHIHHTFPLADAAKAQAALAKHHLGKIALSIT